MWVPAALSCLDSWRGRGLPGLSGRQRRRKTEDLGWKEEDDLALWDPRVRKENRETAGANCVLGMKIFLLYPGDQIYSIRWTCSKLSPEFAPSFSSV
jgi:hypothetical protein